MHTTVQPRLASNIYAMTSERETEKLSCFLISRFMFRATGFLILRFMKIFLSS